MSKKEKRSPATEEVQAVRSGAIQGDGRLSSFEWVESLIIAIIVVGIVFTFVFRIVTVSGSSMYPNLQHGDRLIVTSWFYTPQAGDIVVLKRTDGLNEPIVKRVIATEGQNIYIDYDAGDVYVDGQILDETAYLGDTKTYRPMASEEEIYEFPEEGLEVPEGYIFVLGDNRSVSKDSRYRDVYMVDERYILGKAQFILFPFSRLGVVA